jgi:hypothetical protein
LMLEDNGGYPYVFSVTVMELVRLLGRYHESSNWIPAQPDGSEAVMKAQLLACSPYTRVLLEVWDQS